MIRTAPFVLALIMGCTGSDSSDDPTGAGSPDLSTDADRDGFDRSVDCNDNDAAINPDAEEICDGLDNNCDAVVDEDAIDRTTFYADYDGDGYGDEDRPLLACTPSKGMVDNADDCNDAEGGVNPGATERCDGFDTDCNPQTPEDGTVSAFDGVVWSDRTATFKAATVDDPLVLEYPDGSGNQRLNFCGGTFYVDIEVQGDSNLVLSGRSGTSELSGGTDHTILTVNSDDAVVNLEGLTLRDGFADAFATPNLSLEAGGAIYCSGSSTMNISDSRFSDNDASVGGALYTNGCTIRVTRTDFTNNSAGFGGGLFAFGGRIDLFESSLTGNTAETSGGAIVLEATQSGDIEMTMTLTSATSNSATYGGAMNIVAFDGNRITATCIGSDKTTDGFASNAAAFGGAVHLEGAASTFESVGCDFGLAEQANTPDDISLILGATTYNALGADANVVCDENACL